MAARYREVTIVRFKDGEQILEGMIFNVNTHWLEVIHGEKEADGYMVFDIITKKGELFKAVKEKDIMGVVLKEDEVISNLIEKKYFENTRTYLIRYGAGQELRITANSSEELDIEWMKFCSHHNLSNKNLISIEHIKPECPLIGQNGNIFNLIGIVHRTLLDNGLETEAQEVVDRITKKGEAGSYEEALNILMEYVEVTEFDGEDGGTVL